MSIPKENDERTWKNDKKLQEDELPPEYEIKKKVKADSRDLISTRYRQRENEGPLLNSICQSGSDHLKIASERYDFFDTMENSAKDQIKDADDKRLQDITERREMKNYDAKTERKMCYMLNCPVNKKLKHEKLCNTDECPAVIRKKIIKETKKSEKCNKKNPLMILGEAVINTFMDKESSKLSKNEKKWKKKYNLETPNEQLQDFNNSCCQTKDKLSYEHRYKYLSQQEDSNSLLEFSKPVTTSCTTLKYPISKNHEVTKELIEKSNYNDEQSQLNYAMQSRLNSLRGCPNTPCKLKEKDEIYFAKHVPKEIKERSPQLLLSCYENYSASERDGNPRYVGADIIEMKEISGEGVPRRNEMKGERTALDAGKGSEIKGQEKLSVIAPRVRGSFNEERTFCSSGNINYLEEKLTERTRSKQCKGCSNSLSETANNFSESYNDKMDRSYLVNDVAVKSDLIPNSHAFPVLLKDKECLESTGFRKRIRSDKSDIDIGTISPLKAVADVDVRENKISKNNDNSPSGQSFRPVINWNMDQAPVPKEIDARASNKFDATKLSNRNNGIDHFENIPFYEKNGTAVYALSNSRSEENNKNPPDPTEGLEYSSKRDEKPFRNSLKNLRQTSADNLIKKASSKKVTISEEDADSDCYTNSSDIPPANKVSVHLLDGTKRNYRNFSEDPNIIEHNEVPRNKVTFVGANSISSACAMSLILKDITREIMFYDDQSVSRLLDDTIDIRRASSYTEQSNILCSNDPTDTATSQLVIIIGENASKNQNKMNVVRKNIQRLNNYVRNLAEHSPEAVFLVAVEPVDLMSWVVWRMTQLPSNQVIGTGTNLDTVNLRNLLAKKVNLPINIIDAWIIGERGENCLPVWSSVNMVDSKLSHLSGSQIAEEWSDILEAFVRGNADTNSARGHLEWTVIMSIVDLCQTILQNRKNVHSVSTLVGGHYDVDLEVFLSVPCKISARGVQNIIKLRLTKREKELFKHSATVCKKVLNDCQLNLPAGDVIEVPEEDEEVFSSFPVRR
ncbi:uncharacterized protein LOC107265889 isoform X2 [Cephus cinctus]|uniref:Uncharacterized protein LOC107265889 isoform X2 n=1 Tax=Cephus cinctus TaxID=211228 RepID=A0AAJ7RDS8_CEPCN|nr:uncharacterized protein LOC107265889 isoform X2 [Cephus cinctus]